MGCWLHSGFYPPQPVRDIVVRVCNEMLTFPRPLPFQGCAWSRRMALKWDADSISAFVLHRMCVFSSYDPAIVCWPYVILGASTASPWSCCMTLEWDTDTTLALFPQQYVRDLVAWACNRMLTPRWAVSDLQYVRDLVLWACNGMVTSCRPWSCHSLCVSRTILQWDADPILIFVLPQFVRDLVWVCIGLLTPRLHVGLYPSVASPWFLSIEPTRRCWPYLLLQKVCDLVVRRRDGILTPRWPLSFNSVCVISSCDPAMGCWPYVGFCPPQDVRDLVVWTCNGVLTPRWPSIGSV